MKFFLFFRMIFDKLRHLFQSGIGRQITFHNWLYRIHTTTVHKNSLFNYQRRRLEAFTIMSNLLDTIKRIWYTMKCNLIDASIPQGRYKIQKGKDKQVGRKGIGPSVVRHVTDRRGKKIVDETYVPLDRWEIYE